MSLENERIKKNLEALLQIERQHTAKKIRDKRKKNAVETRRKIIIGELFIKYFPEALSLHPCLNAAKSKIEFECLENFLQTLSNDSQYKLQFSETLSSNIPNV